MESGRDRDNMSQPANESPQAVVPYDVWCNDAAKTVIHLYGTPPYTHHSPKYVTKILLWCESFRGIRYAQPVYKWDK